MNPRGPVEIFAANADWGVAAAAEVQRLSQFGPVEHIGSTAIPGLAAKPILDLMLGVSDLDAAIEPIEALGYLHDQSWDAILANRRYFWRGAPDNHTHHLHVVPFDGAFWQRHLLFRDRLRADAALVAEYEALKRDLASRFTNDRDAYTAGKAAFIERVIGVR